MHLPGDVRRRAGPGAGRDLRQALTTLATVTAPAGATTERGGTARRIRPPGLAALFTLLFGLAGWGIGLGRLSDNSFLWHLRTGHLILDRGIPRADPYSFTVPGRRWVAQSWLAEAAYGLADDLAGGFGVRVLVAIATALLAVLLYRLALRLAGDRLRAAGAGLVAFGSVVGVWSERPLLFGMLALAALVWIVEVPGSLAGRRPLVAVPLLLWLWANVHGTVALGLAYLALHVAGRWLEAAPPWAGRERTLVLSTAAGTLLMFANPYGLDLVLFPVRLVGSGTIADVVEWMSPDFHGRTGAGFALWLAVLVVALAAGRHRPSRRELAVAVPFVLLALWAVRNVGPATIVTLPLVSRAVARSPRADERSPLGWVSAAAILAVAGAFTARAAGEPDFRLTGYPVRAWDAVEAGGFEGERVFTSDVWAGYLIWRAWPDQQVFMDDRYDMYPVRVVDDYTEVARVEPRWRAVLDDYRVGVVVWRSEGALAQALALDPAWERVHADGTAVVFARREPAAARADRGPGA